MTDKSIAIPLINLSSHGGVRIIVELSNYLSEAGYDVTLVVPKGRVGTAYSIDGRVKVREIGPSVRNRYLHYFLYFLFLPFYLSSYKILIANFFPTYYPVFLGAKLFGSQFFYFVQDIETKYNGPLGVMLNLFCRMTYLSSRSIIAANGYLRYKLASDFCIEVKSIDIGLSKVFFENLPFEGEKEYDLIYFLRHEPWKRKEVFYDVVGALKTSRDNFKVLCVSQDDILLREAFDLGLEICKPSSDIDLIRAIDKSRVMLLTSSYEGFGLPPLECMARGVPAVVFACGGPGVYIRNKENSFIVNSVPEAANIIGKLLDDDFFRRRIGKAGMISAEGFKNELGFDQFRQYISS